MDRRGLNCCIFHIALATYDPQPESTRPHIHEINNRIIPEKYEYDRLDQSIQPEDQLCLPATTTNFATSSCASGEAEVVHVASVMWHVAHAGLRLVSSRSCAWPALTRISQVCSTLR